MMSASFDRNPDAYVRTTNARTFSPFSWQCRSERQSIGECCSQCRAQIEDDIVPFGHLSHSDHLAEVDSLQELSQPRAGLHTEGGELAVGQIVSHELRFAGRSIPLQPSQRHSLCPEQKSLEEGSAKTTGGIELQDRLGPEIDGASAVLFKASHDRIGQKRHLPLHTASQAGGLLHQVFAVRFVSSHVGEGPGVGDQGSEQDKPPLEIAHPQPDTGVVGGGLSDPRPPIPDPCEPLP